MSFITPAALRLKEDLEKEFPNITFGIYNRRKIAGSSVWSQHSWPNALDIFFTHYGDTSPGHQAKLDAVNAWIKARASKYDVRYRLWRIVNHWDHIHVDFWPKGYGTPSIVRGGASNRYQYPDGTVITQAQLVQGEEEDDIMKVGDTGQRVEKAQKRLLLEGYELPKFGADGDFGSEMEAAVIAFQNDNGLEPDGVLRAVDLAVLFRKDHVARNKVKAVLAKLAAVKDVL